MSTAYREVRRAVSELRQGFPVVIHAPSALVVLSAEAASPGGVDDLLDETVERSLVLTAGQTPFTASPRVPWAVQAFRAPHDLLASQPLNALTAAGAIESLEETPVTDGALAAMTLARLARLAPALIVGTTHRPVNHLAQARASSIHRLAASAPTGQLRLVAEAPMPLAAAPHARLLAFRSEFDASEHLAVVIGAIDSVGAPLVRIHSKCLTGDLLGSLRCDCGPQLHDAVRQIAESGAGVLVYLDQEGRGIGLVNKLRAYGLQDLGFDTLDANVALGYPADDRDFQPAAAILRAMGIRRLKLLTNNPAKVAALHGSGFEVISRVPLAMAATRHNAAYLETKRVRCGHLLPA